MMLSDRIEDIAFWIALPLVRITEDCECKAVRVAGVLLSFAAFPLLCVIALPLLVVAMIVGLLEDI